MIEKGTRTMHIPVPFNKIEGNMQLHTANKPLRDISLDSLN